MILGSGVCVTCTTHLDGDNARRTRAIMSENLEILSV